MLRLFKQGIPMQQVIIIMAVLLLWSNAFVHPTIMAPSSHFAPIYDLLFELLAGSPRLATAIALILVIGEGLLFNEILYSKNMVSQNTLLPMFFYVLFMSFTPASHTITPALLTNILLLIAMSQLMQVGQPNITVSNLASAAACVSIASMCFLPAIFLIIPLVALVPIFKMYNWNNWMAMLLGLIGPYLTLALIYFYQDTLMAEIDVFGDTLANLNLAYQGTTIQYVTGAILLALALVFLMGGLSQTSSKTTVYKNNVSIIELPMISSLLMMVYLPLVPFQMQWFALGTTFAAYNFFWHTGKKIWIYELMLILLIAVVAMGAWL